MIACQLSLDDAERDAFADHLDGINVAELVWREAGDLALRQQPTAGRDLSRSGGAPAPAPALRITAIRSSARGGSAGLGRPLSPSDDTDTGQDPTAATESS